MPGFTFRAQAALDLRRKQDEEARRRFGEATQAERRAVLALDEATAAVSEAIRTANEASAGASDVTVVTWHRNWITSRQHDAQHQSNRVEQCQADTAAAALEAQQARRKMRSLERLRDRALQAYLAAERRQQQKQLDALGTMRYALRKASEEDRP